ncbi:MAG: DUF4198 domain-containing protein [Polaromonas sp.]|nr:DUF4198 domain-containing protein [Polaromonas sp.]
MKLTSFPLIAALAALLFGAQVRAHEFWFAPVTQALKAGSAAELSLYVGEYFDGVLVGFSAPQTASLKHISSAGTRDLRAQVPAQPVASMSVPLSAPGTHLIAYDSQPSQIELPAGRFQAYLHDEGLDFIQKQREAAGAADTPGRERYRRNVKTLFAVGEAPAGPVGQAAAAPEKIYAVRVGHRLELVPLNDPLRMPAGGALGLELLFDGKPLEGALIKAWHRRSGQTLMIRAISSKQGQVSLDLPYAGAWMVSAVHMVPATGVKDIDWDSLWANLSFVVPGRSVGR